MPQPKCGPDHTQAATKTPTIWTGGSSGSSMHTRTTNQRLLPKRESTGRGACHSHQTRAPRKNPKPATSNNIPNPNKPSKQPSHRIARVPRVAHCLRVHDDHLARSLASWRLGRLLPSPTSPEMAASPLLLPEEETPRLHGVVVIALPDHDGGPSSRGKAPPVAAAFACSEDAGVADAAWRLGRRMRRVAEALMVLAALAVAGRFYSLYSADVAVRFLGKEWKWSEGGASFLLPLYPKAGAGGAVKVGAGDDAASAENSTAVLPVRGNVFPDGQYYTSIYIGNPPRPYFLDIDTGSDLTWIQCDAPCTNCPKGPHPLYKPAKGNIIPPRDSLCQELQGNQNYCDTCKQCDYEITYADRSSSMGVLARDNMQLITADGERENLDFVFGCAYDQQGKLMASPASTDGILGLSNGAISLPTQLANQGIISNVFGHCITTDPSSVGYMFLGDDYIPRWGMTWVPVRNGPENVYSTEVQKVNYGHQELSVLRQAGKLTQVIFDSGSSYTYFPRIAYKNLIALLKDVSPSLVQDDSDQTLPFCMKANFPVRSVDDVKQLFRPLHLQFRKRWLVVPRTFTIPPENYLIISDKGNVCLGVLDGTEIGHSSTIIIGDVSLHGKLVVYDNDENQIGWVQSDCTKPQKQSRVPFFLSRALRNQFL